LAAAAALIVASAGRSCSFSINTNGMNKKLLKPTLHTRSNLKPQVLEVPLPEPKEEREKPAPLPTRRIPYTMHILSQFPGNKHLQDDGATYAFVKEKIEGALRHAEDIIHHVEVRIQMLEHFHKLKPNHKPVPEGAEKAVGDYGEKAVAPYQIKVNIGLKRGGRIVLDNPEKNAMPTLPEAVDNAADGLRRLLREAKLRERQIRRRQSNSASFDELDFGDDVEIEAESGLLDSELADPAVDEFYSQVEAKMHDGEAM